MHIRFRSALLALTIVAAMPAFVPNAHAQVVVGGAPMYANKDIIDNAVNSKDHTTLVAAVKAAGLVETLKGRGPFTVSARHGRYAAQAREQAHADEGADLPCGAGPA